jgi:hypothetical protein
LPLFVISEEIDHRNNITTLRVSPSSPPPSQKKETNNPSRNPNPNNLNYLDTLSQTKHSCTQQHQHLDLRESSKKDTYRNKQKWITDQSTSTNSSVYDQSTNEAPEFLTPN